MDYDGECPKTYVKPPNSPITALSTDEPSVTPQPPLNSLKIKSKINWNMKRVLIAIAGVWLILYFAFVLVYAVFILLS